MAGSHGLRQKGSLVYDENLHVPLVIAHPDIPGGTRTDALASAVDIAPTLPPSPASTRPRSRPAIPSSKVALWCRPSTAGRYATAP